MKQALLILTIISLFFHKSTAQIAKTWHQNMGAASTDLAYSVVTDNHGNIYTTGSFTGNVDFDPSPTSTYILSTTAGNTESDIFVQKLDVNGNFLWANSYGSSGNYADGGTEVAVDDSGNVYVTGYYTNDIQFLPNDTVYYGGSSTWGRPCLIKIDSTGNTLWGLGWKNIADQPTQSKHITIDDWGRVHMSGYMRGTMDFDPTHHTVQNFTSAGVWDAFLTRIKPNGRVDKVRLIGDVSWDYSYATAIDGKDLYFIGVFKDSVDFSTTSTPDVLFGSGSSGSCFITKMDTAYNHNWAKGYAEGGQPISLAISNSNKIYTTGNFTWNADFDPSANNHTLSSNGNQDIFIQILDTSGAFIDAYSIGGTGEDRPYHIGVAPNEDIAITGRFNNTVDFDPKAGTYNMTSLGGNDGYVVKLDLACTFIQAAQFGGSGNDNFYGLDFINNSEIVACGWFENTIDVNPDLLITENITSAGGSDIVTVKLSTCSFSYGNIQASACVSYTVPSGNHTYTASGTYKDTLTGTTGCDSILTISLTVYPNNINATVTQTIDGLEAQATGSNLNYQWFDCTTNQPVAGATSQTFMPTANGNYSVIVNDGNCIDTSACYTINNVSISENALLSHVTLFPNPTNGMIQINCDFKVSQINVLDLTGRVVLTNKDNDTIDLSALTTGVYLVQVDTEKGTVVRRIVKK